MKFAIFIALVLFGIANCAPADENALQRVDTSSSSSEEDLAEAINSFQKLVNEKCKKEGVTSKNVTAIALRIQECLDEHVPNTAEELKSIKKPDSSEEICADAGKPLKIRECFNEAIDLWKECADDEEKYLPDFFFDAVDNLYQFVCVDDGANLLKVFENSTLECVETLINNENTLKVCEDTIKGLKLDDDDTVLTKPLLCGGLTSVKTCYSDFITKQCPNDSNVKDLLNGVVNAVTKTC